MTPMISTPGHSPVIPSSRKREGKQRAPSATGAPTAQDSLGNSEVQRRMQAAQATKVPAPPAPFAPAPFPNKADAATSARKSGTKGDL